MPCYNHESFVSETLRSIFQQTYRNLELIVIDDGSSDQSRQVITNTIAECAFPTRFIARGNRGAPQTINDCIREAKGHYVAVINSDDRFELHRIELMVRMLATSGTRWGFSGIRFMDEQGLPLALCRFQWNLTVISDGHSSQGNGVRRAPRGCPASA